MSMIQTGEVDGVAEVADDVVEATETETVDEGQVMENEDGTTESTSEEMIFGKYKDMDAATKAFKTLESENGRLRREKSPEAPEEYKFDFSEDADLKGYVDGIDLSQDPLMAAITPVMKEHGISQDAAAALVKAKLAYDASTMVDVDAELEKLGSEGPQVIAEVETFVQKNYSVADQEILAQIATSAEGVKFIKNNLMKSKQMPGEDVNTVTESSDELFAKAQEIRKGENFSYDTGAIARYEKIMDQATKLQMKGL